MPRPSLALYVHLPFCRVRCSYCPFAISTDTDLEERYLAALITEIGRRFPAGARISSLYLGGGTPSHTSPGGLAKLFDAIGRLERDEAIEVTLEANPEDVTPESVRLWMALGINRISIGVQSLDDRELRPLRRVHSADDALRAIALSLDAGFRTSADLIIGLPQQSGESFGRSLRGALESGVGHMSVYMLDLEEGTFLERQVSTGRVALPDDEEAAQQYLRTVETARDFGLEQYEISNFARPGEESTHNLKYWTRAAYLGVGLGAHSFLGDERSGNATAMRDYLGRIEKGSDAIVFRERITEVEERHERIFLSLRQTRGIEYSDLVQLCGPEGEEWQTRGLEDGWLQRSGTRVGFTPRGFLLSNEYISQLF
jgi:oxygen-independent coproporphyrinogen III oxidase